VRRRAGRPAIIIPAAPAKAAAPPATAGPAREADHGDGGDDGKAGGPPKTTFSAVADGAYDLSVVTRPGLRGGQSCVRAGAALA